MHGHSPVPPPSRLGTLRRAPQHNGFEMMVYPARILALFEGGPQKPNLAFDWIAAFQPRWDGVHGGV